MKKVTIKLFIATLSIVALFIVADNYNVKAGTIETIEEALDADEKIMQYDVITGEITEVNMEEMKKTLASTNKVLESCSNVSKAKYDKTVIYQPRVTFNKPLYLRFGIFC